MTRENEWGQPIGPALPGWVPPIVPPRTTLVGRSCRVEPLDAAKHARALFEANDGFCDARSFTYLPYGPFGTFDEYVAWLGESCRGDDPSFFAIVSTKTDTAVGVASYLRIAAASGSIEVGHLHFSPRLQRTVAATEAMFLMMKNAFELGYRRYEWKCDALNAPSRAAAERLGFSFEGVFRQATVYKHRSRDTAWYSIVDGEWSELERAFTAWLAPENFDGAGIQRRSLATFMRAVRR